MKHEKQLFLRLVVMVETEALLDKGDEAGGGARALWVPPARPDFPANIAPHMCVIGS